MDNIKMKFLVPKNEMSFNKMLLSLSSFLAHKYPDNTFIIDMDESSLKRFSNSFTGPSNRVSGYLINSKDSKREYCVWCYNDQEYAKGWIFSEDGPVFGEVVL